MMFQNTSYMNVIFMHLLICMSDISIMKNIVLFNCLRYSKLELPREMCQYYVVNYG